MPKFLAISLLACRNGDAPTPDTPLDSTDTGCVYVSAYPDQDGDSYGLDPAVEVCEETPGYVDTPGDCDDTDPTIYPGATDWPLDDIDQDCDGADNRDGDGDGDPVDTDCDDSDPERSTLFFELCDTGVDENCDGVIDEDCQYFGGVASGSPDRRIEGIWVDDWQNNSRAGKGVFGLPDISGDGVPELAVAGDTYDQRFVHIFSGQDVLDNEVVDFDDALFAVNQGGVDLLTSELQAMFVYSNEIDDYLVIQGDTCHLLPISEAAMGTNLDDSIRGGSSGTCHKKLLEGDYPTRMKSGIGLSLYNYNAGAISVTLTHIDLDDNHSSWSATDDWNGDGVNEIFVSSYILDEIYSSPQSLWHGQGPFDLDTAYPSDVLTLMDQTTSTSDLYLSRGRNRPDLSEDVDGDGLPELFIEADNFDEQRELYVWTDTTQIDLANPDLRVVNLDHNTSASNLGTFHLGDINCDGHADLTQQYVDSQASLGAVALALGPLGSGTIEIQSDPDGLLSTPLDQGLYVYGYSTAFVDDLNGDGCQELLVGDQNFQTDPERYGPGAAHLFLGAPGGL